MDAALPRRFLGTPLRGLSCVNRLEYSLAASPCFMKTLPASLPKRIARVLMRGTGLAWGVVACLSEYLLRRLAGPLPELTRIEVLHRWSRRTLPRMGITIDVTGLPPSTGLIASNHLSYLDILVYSAVAP